MASQRIFARWLPVALQAGVSLALLWWIFHDRGFRQDLWEVLQSADRGWLVMGVAVAGVSTFLCILRWQIFLRVLDIRISLWDCSRIYLVGLFFNMFLPGAIGGDVIKIVMLAMRGQSKSLSLISVLMDRISGLGSMIILSVTLVLIRYEWLMQSPQVANAITFIFVYMAACSLGLGIGVILAYRKFPLPRFVPLQDKIEKFEQAVRKVINCWRQALLAVGVGTVMHALHFGVFFCAAEAYHAGVPLWDFMAIMPAVDIISALPVSLGGFGVREKLFEVLLGQLSGVPPKVAIAISLCGYVLSAVWGLVGAIVFPVRKLPWKEINA